MRAAAACVVALAFTGRWAAAASDAPDIGLFFQAASSDEKRSRAALELLANSWKDGYAPIVVDLARFMRASHPTRQAAPDPSEGLGEPIERPVPDRGQFPTAGPRDPGALGRARLIRFLERQTGQRLGDDLQAWRRWMWSRPYDPHPDYATFKSALYAKVDPRMGEFFAPGTKALIRLDEIDWGGVKVNGIPPLDHPAHVPAAAASYLNDDHVVFGVFLNGEARAYPKRILAWHELARDALGGVDLAIVYCTLCGTVVPYGTGEAGRKWTLGTSGLLYRSNKLLFDEETGSLWSTLEGRPVVGTLVGSGLELTAHPVVTTTWREWRAVHPGTTVLSLQTGHERDYAEGAAYREYFATDRLMFAVPGIDRRLKNKDEVLALRLQPAGSAASAEPKALALDVDFLAKRPLHQLSFAGHELVIVTTRGGANRVYEAGGVSFRRGLPDGGVEDGERRRWTVTEAALVGPDGERRPRVPARRAFWFGWHAQFPDTELVK